MAKKKTFNYEEETNKNQDFNNEEQQALVELVEMEFRSAWEAKASLGLMRDLSTFEDYWAGRVNPPETEDHPGSNTNIVQPIIESQVADLVDQPLDILLKGEEPADQIFAKNTQAMVKWVWRKNNPELKLDRFERQRLKFGSAVWKVWFDPYALNERGLPTVDPLNLANFFPDPKVKDYLKLQDADFIIHAMPKSIKYLRRRFGERAKYVEANPNPQYDPPNYHGEANHGVDAPSRSQALLIERWSREVDEDGKSWLRVCHIANGVLLRDSGDTLKNEKTGKPESFYRKGKYPFVFVPCYTREGVLWGMGDVELLKPVQDLINDFDDQIRMNARLMGNMQIVVGIATGINLNKWTNKPGLKIPARDPSSFKVVDPPQMPSYIPNRRDKAFNEAEILSGRSDVVEGRQSGSLRAASAIISMQEAGLRRVNHKRLVNQMGLVMVVELLLDYIKEFYTEEMAFRVSEGDPQSQDNDFLWFTGSELKEIDVLRPDRNSRDDDGKMTMMQLKDEEGKLVKKEAEFDIEVIVGAGIPNNKAFVYQAVVELHREGIVTNTEARLVLKEFINWPVIDPHNPVGEFQGRNMNPEQLAMMNMNQGGQMTPEMMQNLPPEVMAQMGMSPEALGGQDPAAAAQQGMPPDIMAQVANMLGGSTG